MRRWAPVLAAVAVVAVVAVAAGLWAVADDIGRAMSELVPLPPGLPE